MRSAHNFVEIGRFIWQKGDSELTRHQLRTTRQITDDISGGPHGSKLGSDGGVLGLKRLKNLDQNFVNTLRKTALLASSVLALSLLAMQPAQAGLLGNADDDNGLGSLNIKEAPIAPSGKPTTVTEIVDGLQQMPMLQSNSAALLQQDLARYQSIQQQGGFPKVPSSYYHKGDTGGGVAILNKRLYLEGYLRVEGTQGQFANIFTSATQDALIRYQRNHGLAQNGRVDQATYTELNIPVENLIAAINANIPRLQVYEEGLGDRYVVVNIPATQAEAVSNGRVFERHNTIVGRPSRPTPIVITQIDTVKFNPYWNAPTSIVRKDILPKLKNGNGYLHDINMKILEGGPNGQEVDPSTLNFNTIDATKYLFRQEPGPENAMATAKIEFHSPFGIYLHDTSEKELFNYDHRFYSSGCIRIEKMPQLVNWVLNGMDGYNAERIAELGKTLERVDVPMTPGPQLRVAYLTAWPAANGTVAFRPDIYQMDGTGFTVGQPMPVGQMSPDGQRFVLKPLPNAPQFDAAVSNGKLVSPGASAKPAIVKVSAQTSDDNQPSLMSNSTVKVGTTKGGFFDWAAYRKEQAAKAAAAAAPKKTMKKLDAAVTPDAKKVDGKAVAAVPPAKKDAAKTAVASKDPTAADKTKPLVTDEKTKAATATAPAAAKPAVKPVVKKKPACTDGTDPTCKTAAAAPVKAGAIPTPDAAPADGTKTP